MGTLARRRAASVFDRASQQEISIRRFRPILPLNYQRELHLLAKSLQAMGKPEAANLLDDEVVKVGEYRLDLLAAGLERGDLDPTARYVATLQVLRDLLLQGWELRSDEEGLILDSPDLAGAYYREEAIPGPWRRRLAHRLLIEHFAGKLFRPGGPRGQQEGTP